MQRYKLDKQISSGQKITLPEDDGMRLGRVIDIDTEKGKLAQYQKKCLLRFGIYKCGAPKP